MTDQVLTEQVSVDLSCLLPGAGGDPAAAVQQALGLGFTAVEPVAFDRHVRAYRSALADSGVSAPSGRATLLDAAQPERVLDAAAELGIAVVVDGCTDASLWADEERVLRLADRLNHLTSAARARGLRLAYRTGDVELRTTVHGTHALHVLVRHLDPDTALDVDVFRAAASGTNAELLLQVLGSRVALVHLSDGSFDPPVPRPQPLGRGGLNLARVLRAAPQAARVLTFETPAPEDAAAGAAAALGESLRWLQDHQTPVTAAPPMEGTP